MTAQDDDAALGNWMPEMLPLPPEDAGTVAIDLAGPVEAGSMQRFSLTYTAGRYGIDDTGSIKICWRFASDMGKPQFVDPAAANYVSVRASNGARLETRFDLKANTRPYDRTLHIKVLRGFMRLGDTITAALGVDQSGPGLQMQSFVDPDFAFRVLADPIATYTFVAVPGVPALPIEAGPAEAWHLVLPTQRAVGDAVTLSIRADDAWGNPTARHDGQTLSLTVDGPLGGIPATGAMPAGEITLQLEGLTALHPGVVRITARDATGRMVAGSNPLVIQAAATRRAYWGDLHAQSGETIGSGTAEAYLRYARDFAFLDAVGHQGNDFQITPAFWRRLNRLMAEWNAPGRFVTVPGYEWSGNTALGGDRNVFFETEDRPIRRSSHALVAERCDLATDCWDARALFDALRPEAATTVMWAHCGGRYADIRYAHDPELERSVEVHSSWGTFEWLVDDAFDLRLRVGIVANSDGHKGRPGHEPPGASLFGALGGLTCYLLPELSRRALFDAMRARHHYATTGCRLHLHTGVEDAIMGDVVSTPASSVRFAVTVEAASPILSVELRRGREVLEVIRPHAADAPGPRVRIEWSGAEYRGRGRETVWDGAATVTGGTILAARAINFLNPQWPLRHPAPDRVEWSSITTGNLAGADLTLSDDAVGITVVTPHATVERKLSALGAEPLVTHCGGLGRQLRLSRLPAVLPTLSLSLSLDRTVELVSGDNPLFVCVTLEDGHQAWSSPIYVVRETH